MTHQQPIKLIALLSGVCALTASAQTPSSDAPPSETVQMEKYEVSDVPLNQQILPTSRPFNSVFGTDDNIVDVPRNVTIISRQQLNDISITEVSDFSKLTSSAFTTTNFGAPSNASIRGQSADLFLNGLRSRITSNGNGLPLDFNSVESVNIVKGPATAVQGSSMYVGGFIDLISKRPYFDAAKGSVSYTIGSYGVNRWTIDAGAPISKELAYRFSYSGEDSQGYSYDYYKKTHSLYGALTWKPTPNYELFLNATGFIANYTENWGVNRVTQALIDNGTYQTGININNGAAATPSDPQNSKFVLDGGNVLALGPTVSLNRHLRLLKPGDHSIGHEYSAQAIQTIQVGPELKIVNSTIGSYTSRNTLSSYYYSEIIDPSWFAENRTEVIITLKELATINAGLDLRYQRTKAYDDYFFEPANVWDLTKDHAYINVYNSAAFFGRFVGQPVPGWLGRFATQGVINGDTNDSSATTAGPFIQSTWKFMDNKLNFVAGGRYDFFHAHVREPLPPVNYEDSINVTIPSLNSSLIFKPTPNSSVYATYNYSQNTSGAVGNGGGITGWSARPDGSEFLDKENFTQPSVMYEIGSKYSLMQNKLFFNVALYNQTRTQKSTSSTIIQKFRARGIEAELNYQPNKYFYGTFSWSAINATTSAPFQSDGGISPALLGEIAASGVGQVTGLPKNLFNALASYSMSNGFGVSANTVVTSPMNNNFAGTLVIPWQYEIDASAFYHYKKWDFRMNVLNLTDEKNWGPPNAVYGNGSILPMPGIQFQFTIKHSF